MPSIEKLDCLGLATEWENNSDLRERIRSEQKVLLHDVGQKFCHATRSNANKNAMVLLPVLGRMSATKKWTLPHLDDLEVEIHTLYDKCGLNTGKKGPYQTSVEVKRLCGLVKRKARRKEVTKETGYGMENLETYK